jgi:hypothetical protein
VVNSDGAFVAAASVAGVRRNKNQA